MKKQTNKMNKKELRMKLMEMFDKVTFKRNGEIECRRSYYYRENDIAEAILSKIKGLGLTVIDVENHFHQWPMQSFYIYRLKRIEKHD